MDLRVVGDGTNHWPLVYDRDLADLYARLAAHEDAADLATATWAELVLTPKIVPAASPITPAAPAKMRRTLMCFLLVV